MIKNSHELLEEYSSQEQILRQKYGQWWIDMFKHYGFTIINTDRYWRMFEMTYNGKTYKVNYCPSHYMGIKIYDEHWNKVAKCQTENGVRKFLKSVGIKP